jgi:hypothetical protein
MELLVSKVVAAVVEEEEEKKLGMVTMMTLAAAMQVLLWPQRFLGEPSTHKKANLA